VSLTLPGQGCSEAASEEKPGTCEDGNSHVSVTYRNCERISGPLFHGTKSTLEAGDELVPGYRQSYRTRHPLRVPGEMEAWQCHDPEAPRAMLDRLALLPSVEHRHMEMRRNWIVPPLFGF
jgi:hypothetical protein